MIEPSPTVDLAEVTRPLGESPPADADEVGPNPAPFLKWAGGKTRLLRHLLPHVPDSIGDYHEPFAGGGAMFFAIRSRVRGKSHLADLNDELINTWHAVQRDPLGLLARLADYAARDSKAFYYAARAAPPAEPLDRAAWFVYLNQTSWNGLWRVNRRGEFNVPWGARQFRGIDERFLLAVHRALAGVSIVAADFRAALRNVGPGAFVYLDPPYLPVSDTSKFSFYTERRFRAPDLSELAEVCNQLTVAGATWMLSNRDTATVRSLFHHHHIVPLTTRRSVAAQNRRDVEPIDSPEVIIIGAP